MAPKSNTGYAAAADETEFQYGINLVCVVSS